jgi:hypothetical protein
MKVCSKCKIEKTLDCFHFRKDRNNYQANCKECRRKRDREYNIKIGKNSFKKLKFKELLDNGFKKCLKCNTIKNLDCFGIRNDRLSKRMSSCKECRKKYTEENRERINNYTLNRLKTDPLYKLTFSIRNNIRGCFKRGNNKFIKSKKTENILGCTIQEFIDFIQSQFQKGMTLENHGEWHLDHIIPLASASSEEEIIKLNHYTNFQPLWAIDNLKKSNKLITKLN